MQQKRYKDRNGSSHSRSHSQGRRNNNGGGGNGGGNGGGGQRGERAKMMLFKYLDKAKDALASGDRITAEHYFQYADHYARLMEDPGQDV